LSATKIREGSPGFSTKQEEIRRETVLKLEDYVRTDETGEMFVTGHRVPIQSILWAHIEQGMDGKQLAKRFDTLSVEEVYAVLAYYYRNKPEVDKYLRETEKELARQEQDYRREHTGATKAVLEERLHAKRERILRESRVAQ
jgi:uncharacterized protein (DUF433 family)